MMGRFIQFFFIVQNIWFWSAFDFYSLCSIVFLLWYKALRLNYFVSCIDVKSFFIDLYSWSSYFSVSVSWVIWLAWTVHGIVPDSYCDRERTVSSLMATTDSHHGYQSASPVAHRTTVVTSAKPIMTTSAKQKGKSVYQINRIV